MIDKQPMRILPFPTPSTDIQSNSFLWCEATSLSAQQHTVTIIPSFPVGSGRFWLDYIVYDPLPKDALDDVWLQVANNDPDIVYSGMWPVVSAVDGGPTARETTKTGNFVRYTFTGEYLCSRLIGANH